MSAAAQDRDLYAALRGRDRARIVELAYADDTVNGFRRQCRTPAATGAVSRNAQDRDEGGNGAAAETAGSGQSPGQLAYERDVARRPTYYDGSPRRTWQQLSDIARNSWERNPTDRAR